MTHQNAIFISFDDNYLSYAKSCINSILSNYPSHPTILINYSGKHKVVDQKYISSGRIKFLHLSNDFGFSLGPIKNSIVYDRLLLWSDLFGEFEKILHLDADTIVLQPLDELFESSEFYITSDNHKLARALKIHDQRIRHNMDSHKTKQCNSLIVEDDLQSINKLHKMGNAGVFVIPRKNRGKSEFNAIMQLANRYNEYLAYADQSIISLWCARHGIEPKKHLKFNYQVRFLVDCKTDVDDIHILHFSGEAKFYNGFIESPKHIAIYRQCDSLRLFYRTIRTTSELEGQLQSLKHLL